MMPVVSFGQIIRTFEISLNSEIQGKQLVSVHFWLHVLSYPDSAQAVAEYNFHKIQQTQILCKV